MTVMDWLVVAIGAIIIIAAALLSYWAGKRKGFQQVITDYKDSVSLRGLSPQARDKMMGYVQIVQVWDENRRPDKHKFKSVHYD